MAEAKPLSIGARARFIREAKAMPLWLWLAVHRQAVLEELAVWESVLEKRTAWRPPPGVSIYSRDSRDG